MGLLDNIKAAIFPDESDPNGPPPWVDGLKEAKYWSPSGIEFPFIFLDLEFAIPIKSASFGNVDGDGAYIQHNGTGGARYPMLMVLSGEYNDKNAQVALKALTEKGDATLYHPVVGPVNVVPSGEIQQFNKFVTEANQTSFAVMLLETTGLLIGDAQPYPSTLETYLSDSADSFQDSISIEDKAEEVSFAQKVKEAVGKVKKTLDRVSGGVEATQSEVDDIFDSITFAIDTVVGDPLLIARQVQNLMLTPARNTSLIKDKLEAYKNLAADIFLSKLNTGNSYDNTGQNEFAINALMAKSITASMTQIAQNSEFEYKKDIVAAQDQINDTADALIEWSDTSATALGLTDDFGEWDSLSQLVSISVAGLTDVSNKAKTEVKITTSYERPAAAWCFEFYKSIKPDMLIYFQRTNDLGGDEIFIVPEGRELVYYV